MNTPDYWWIGINLNHSQEKRSSRSNNSCLLTFSRCVLINKLCHRAECGANTIVVCVEELCRWWARTWTSWTRCVTVRQSLRASWRRIWSWNRSNCCRWRSCSRPSWKRRRAVHFQRSSVSLAAGKKLYKSIHTCASQWSLCLFCFFQKCGVWLYLASNCLQNRIEKSSKVPCWGISEITAAKWQIDAKK